MPGKLSIYDPLETHSVTRDRGQFPRCSGVFEIAAGRIENLWDQLNRRLRRGMTLDRELFQTPGRPGILRFGEKEEFAYSTRDSRSGKRHLHRLFPSCTHLYFDECNVGAGGTRCLAGPRLVLPRSGVEALALTNAGCGFPGRAPFLGGHTVHPGAPLETVYSLAGGIAVGAKAPPPPLGIANAVFS